MHLFSKDLIEQFRFNADSENAFHMKKYMKDQFEFYGIKQPLRKAIQKKLFKNYTSLPYDELKTISLELWKQPERELQLTVIDLLEKYSKKAPESFIELYEDLITTKSWWDTVDLLATKMVGSLILQHPKLIDSHIEPWSKGNHLWLRRVTLLYQLKYKEKTNTALLASYIERAMGTHEFFLNKAIGWILREYSKTDKIWVKQFISTHPELSNLSVKEGSKYL